MGLRSSDIILVAVMEALSCKWRNTMRQGMTCLIMCLLVVSIASGADTGNAQPAQANSDVNGDARSAPPVIAADEAETLRLMRQEREAEAELAVGAIRLGLLKARVRLAQGKADESIAIATAALQSLDRLTVEVDRPALAGPLNEVIAKAGGTKPDPAGPCKPEQPVLASDMGDQEPKTSDSVEIVVEGDTSGGWPDQVYMKIRETVRLTRPAERDEAARSYQDQALRRLGEDPDIYSKVLVYPDDWAAIRQRRANYDDGLIYRGHDFVDTDGQTKYTAIYDIEDLTMDIPHFTNAPLMDLSQITQIRADREALRQSSEIFSGYPEDLAAGIPLLRYFGGVDDRHMPPAGADRRYQDLLRIIHEVLDAGKEKSDQQAPTGP